MNTITEKAEKIDEKLRKFTDKLFGGLDMSWKNVIIFAVAAAIITAFFLIVPIFKDTSFERMGVYTEAWILFAVIIISNSKKPLESALRTFVFFLISQPMIYLLQVPFSTAGWGIFRYYGRWFILTLLTFPAAYIGWYIKRRDWLSLLILSPVLYLLTSEYVSAFREATTNFPHLIITAFFCLAQVLLYLYVFTSNTTQKAVGFIVPLAAALIVSASQPAVELEGTRFLPDEPSFSDVAVVSMSDSDFVSVTIARTGADSMVYVHASDYGTADFSVIDGEDVHNYTLRVYKDKGGHSQIEID